MEEEELPSIGELTGEESTGEKSPATDELTKEILTGASMVSKWVNDGF